ncbi:hypothetical protein RMATCC62417_04121 [Rhizopus microsporus]|nr:hypothetical protein RMATCC62417_04121 [Rhizopus microsporus]
MDDGIDKLRGTTLVDEQARAEKKLIVGICDMFNDHVYNNQIQNAMNKSEACYRSYIFDGCMKASAKLISSLGYDVVFLPGEIELGAMTTQLLQQGLKDGRLRYYAHSIMIANSHEFLLTEVSSGYNSADNSKVNVWNAGNA